MKRPRISRGKKTTMAKLLQHLGFGAKKKVIISNNQRLDNTSQISDLESNEIVSKLGENQQRQVNNERANGVKVSAREIRNLDGVVDLSLSRSNCDTIKSSSSSLDSQYNLSQHLLQSDSKFSAEMKRQNSGKNYKKNKTSTDGQLRDSNQLRDIPTSQKTVTAGYNLMHRMAATPLPVKQFPNLEDYAEPADFFHSNLEIAAANRSQGHQSPSWIKVEEEDYSEPFEGAAAAISNHSSEGIFKDEKRGIVQYDNDLNLESTYDEVYESKDGHPLNLGQRVDIDVDERPSDEYDAPWEWRAQLMPQLSNETIFCENSDIARANSLEDEKDEELNNYKGSQLSLNMSGKPRLQIYETAFDSGTSRTSVKVTDDDEIINHTIMTSTTVTPTKREALSSIGSGSNSPLSNSTLTGLVGDIKEARTTAKPLSSSPKDNAGGPSSVRERAKRSTEHVVRALVHLPPRSANSTPTLSTYRKDGSLVDNSSSCASSAKSTPTHFLSKCTHHSNPPLRQFSDLTLGEQRKEITLNMSTASMPPTTSRIGAEDGRMDDPGLGSSSSGAVSSEESVASSSSGSSGNNNNSSGCSVNNCHRPFALTNFDLQRTSVTSKPLINRFILQQKPPNFLNDRVVVDTRPSDDYDPPWDNVKGGLNLQKSPIMAINLSSSSSLTTSSIAVSSATISSANASGSSGCNSSVSSNNSDASSLTPPLLRTSICDSDDQHRFIDNNEVNLQKPPSLERPKRPALQLSFNNDSSNRPSLRSNLSLDLNLNSQSPKLKQKDLIFNFGCSWLSTMPEAVDASIPLERQGWYHGAISRTEAENLLRLLQEGSYLVRNSESSRNDYSLSLKSARGFMHMKIVSSDGKYILGQFSKPFNSIPEMIHHYSICKLPIKGAEHMSLLHPVIDQLL